MPPSIRVPTRPRVQKVVSWRLGARVASECVWRKVEARLGPVEDTLEAEAELPRCRGLGCLVAQAERSDAVRIFRRKVAVVDNRQSWPAQERMLGIRKPLLAENEYTLRGCLSQLRGTGIIRVLQQLFQNGKPILVSVSQILTDSLDVCAWRMTKARHGRSSMRVRRTLANMQAANQVSGLMRARQTFQRSRRLCMRLQRCGVRATGSSRFAGFAIEDGGHCSEKSQAARPAWLKSESCRLGVGFIDWEDSGG